MTADEVLAELKALGTEQTRKTMLRHGATEPIQDFRCQACGQVDIQVCLQFAVALNLGDKFAQR